MNLRVVTLLALALLPAPAAEDFQMYQQLVRRPEMGVVKVQVLKIGPDEFTFTAPPLWRMEADAAKQQITFRAPALDASITMQFSGPNAALRPDAQPGEFGQQAVARFPDATIIEEAPCYSGLKAGKLCDVQWTGTNRLHMISRVGVVPHDRGTIEFTLTASEKKFAQFHHAFGSLLTSFNLSAPATQKSPP